MKTIILSLIIICLTIGAPTIYAETAYQAGFKERQRFSDDELSDKTLKAELDIIIQHPHAFYQGWIDSYCSLNPNAASDSDEFTFICPDSRTGAHEPISP